MVGDPGIRLTSKCRVVIIYFESINYTLSYFRQSVSGTENRAFGTEKKR